MSSNILFLSPQMCGCRYFPDGATVRVHLAATAHIILHILETSLQLDAAIKSSRVFKGVVLNARTTGHIVLGLVISAIVITNVTSLWWTYRNTEFKGRVGAATCVVLHMLQLGLVWRFFKLMLAGGPKDDKEFTSLRLLQTTLQDGPFIVIQGCLMIYRPANYNFVYPLSLAVAYVSLVFTFSCFSVEEGRLIKDNKDFRKVEKENRHKCPRSVGGPLWGARVALGVFRHVFLLASRLLAMVLLAHAWGIWLLILVVGHLLCMYAITFIWKIIVQRQLRNSASREEEIAQILLVGYAGVYDSIKRPGQCLKHTVVYLFVILLENTIMTVIWYVDHEQSIFRETFLTLVLVAFALGVVCEAIHIALRRSILSKTDKTGKHDKVETIFQTCTFNTMSKSDQPSAGPDIFNVTAEFDLDLEEILVASSLYKPSFPGELPSVLTSIAGGCSPFNRFQDSLDDKEKQNEAQTSSDSGFVSRILDNSFTLDCTPRKCCNRSTSPSIGNSTPEIEDQCVQINETRVTNITVTSESANTATDRDASRKKETLEFMLNNPRRVFHPNNNLSCQRFTRHNFIDKRATMSWTGDIGRDVSIGYESASSTDYESLPRNNTREILQRKLTVVSRSRSVPYERQRCRLLQYKKSSSLTSESTLSRRRRKCSTSFSSEDSFLDSFYTVSRSVTTTSTTTDSQSLDDSEFGFARTWPPKRRCTIVNISQLPLEQMPVKDRVLSWLREVSQYGVGEKGPDTSNEGPCEIWPILDACSSRLPSSLSGRLRTIAPIQDIKISYIEASSSKTSNESHTQQTTKKNNIVRPRAMSEGRAHRRSWLCGLSLTAKRRMTGDVLGKGGGNPKTNQCW